MYYKVLQKLPWIMDCPLPIPASAKAMTVQIYFSHDEFEDETELCIESWNVRELAGLFTGFCQENHYPEVTITEVRVVRCAETMDALTEMEENL